MGSGLGTSIIIVILVIAVILAVRGSTKHLKGESGCCGVSEPEIKVERRKLSQAYAIKRIVISGMHCDKCKKRVANALNQIPGVDASVNLKKGEALVRLEKEISDEEFTSAVELAGFHVEQIDMLI